MRRKLIIGVLVAAMCVSISATVSAQQVGSGNRGKARMQALLMRADQSSRWWSRPQVVAEVGVTAEQISQLDELADATREARREAMAAFSASHGEFVTVLSEAEIDEAELAARREAMEKEWLAVFAISADHLTAMRAILTAEQWSTLREVQPAATQLGQGRMRGMGVQRNNPAQPDGSVGE